MKDDTLHTLYHSFNIQNNTLEQSLEASLPAEIYSTFLGASVFLLRHLPFTLSGTH